MGNKTVDLLKDPEFQALMEEHRKIEKWWNQYQIDHPEKKKTLPPKTDLNNKVKIERVEPEVQLEL